MIIKRRNEIDYIHILCALIFTLSLVYITSDFGFQPINLVPFLIPITAIIIGLNHKARQANLSPSLSNKKIVITIITTILLGNPATLGALFLLFGCLSVQKELDVHKVVCGVLELTFMISSLYFPVLIIAGIVIIVIVLKTKKVR